MNIYISPVIFTLSQSSTFNVWSLVVAEAEPFQHPFCRLTLIFLAYFGDYATTYAKLKHFAPVSGPVWQRSGWSCKCSKKAKDVFTFLFRLALCSQANTILYSSDFFHEQITSTSAAEVCVICCT